MTVKGNTLAQAHELWVRANARSNNRKAAEKLQVSIQQAPQEDEDFEVDVTDIDKLFADEGRGPHMLELDFVAVGDEPGRNDDTKDWPWRHKYTNKVIKRYRSQSGNQWDTGKLGGYLDKIKPGDGRIAYERAQRIRLLNKKRGKQIVPQSTKLTKEEIVQQWVSPFVSGSS
jgi:hypothetical protein